MEQTKIPFCNSCYTASDQKQRVCYIQKSQSAEEEINADLAIKKKRVPLIPFFFFSFLDFYLYTTESNFLIMDYSGSVTDGRPAATSGPSSRATEAPPPSSSTNPPVSSTTVNISLSLKEIIDCNIDVFPTI